MTQVGPKMLLSFSTFKALSRPSSPYINLPPSSRSIISLSLSLSGQEKQKHGKSSVSCIPLAPSVSKPHLLFTSSRPRECSTRSTRAHKCIKKEVGVSVLWDRQPHRRLLAVRSKLGKESPAPSGLLNRVWQKCHGW